MTVEFHLPDVGEGLHEAEVVQWLVAEGDQIVRNQPFVEILTDKSTVELPAPAAGVVSRLGAGVGQMVTVGDLLIVIEDSASAPPVAVPAAPAPVAVVPAAAVPVAAPAPVAVVPASVPRVVPPVTPSASEAAAAAVAAANVTRIIPPAAASPAPISSPAIALAPLATSQPGRRAKASPSSRRLARELGVDLASLVGTGPGGRILTEDIHGAANLPAPGPEPAAAPQPQFQPEIREAVAPAPQPEIPDAMTPAPQPEIPDAAPAVQHELPVEIAAAMMQVAPADLPTPESPAAESPAAESPASLNNAAIAAAVTPATERLSRALAQIDQVLLEPRVLPDSAPVTNSTNARSSAPAIDPSPALENPLPEPPARAVPDGLGQADFGEQPLVGIRRLTAKAMDRSWSTIPHVTSMDEIDATALLETRTRLRDAAGAAGANITPLTLMTMAVAQALHRFPIMNATLNLEAETITVHEDINVGIAVATDRGLIVPVIKNAEKLSVMEMAAEIARLSAAARDKSITSAELSDGTFTVTNYGSNGGRFASPIIRPGESGIMGFGRIAPRPFVVGAQVIPRQTLPIVLAGDHRIVDGDLLAAFHDHVSKALARPSSILLNAAL